jgi:DDE superfamily endonuclease
MEDVLAVYTRPRDPDRPLVCLDETSKQLIAETRLPIPMKAGRPARFDYEYERNGTANLFMMFAPLEGWRHVKVTDRHTAVDYAHVLKELADIHFANAKTIVLVQDNLNIHSKASLYEAFPAAEARRLVERFEWHYTPKHGSWLDLAESELGILSSQCLDRRIPDKQTLIDEIAAWQHDRNSRHAKANWHFTTANARIKLRQEADSDLHRRSERKDRAPSRKPSRHLSSRMRHMSHGSGLRREQRRLGYGPS